MASIRVRVATTLACTAVAIASGAARPQSTPPASQFRSGVDLVTLDVSALGADGTPIRDLRPEEIKITVAGRPRTLKSFEFVEVAPLRTPVKKGAAAAPVPVAGTTEPASASGRNVFVVVLHEHIRPGNEHVAMEGVRRVIDQLEARDRVAIVTMPFGRVEVDLTTDHERAKKRVHQIVGHADVTKSVPTGTTTTSEAIDLLAFLKSITPLDGPKTVLLISEGFQTGDGPFCGEPGLDTGAALLDRPETTAVAPLLNDLGQLRGEVNDLRTAAAAARAQFYVIQPLNFATDSAFKAPGQERVDLKSLVNDASRATTSQTSALAALAAVVGGRFLQLSGKSEPIFDRIVRETSGYYALAFDTEPQDRDSNPRNVEVSTTRKGVTIRARRTFLDPAPRRGLTTAASVKTILESAVPYGDVRLRAGAAVTRAAGGQVKVLAIAQPIGVEVKEIGFSLVDAQQTSVATWPAELPSDGEPTVSARTVAPGPYRLRVGAIDVNGSPGAVDYDFDATLQAAGALSASSLMTGTQEGASFKPRLIFTPGDDLVPYFELYGMGDVEVTLEIARGPSEPALISSAGELTGTREPDRRLATASIPLGGIVPGNYVVRAVIRAPGNPALRLVATLTVVP